MEIEPRMESALWVIFNEMRLARKAHGPLTKDVVRGITILMEEAGEAAAEALGTTRPGSGRGKDALILELAQVAGVAINMIMNLQEGSNG